MQGESKGVQELLEGVGNFWVGLRGRRIGTGDEIGN